MDRVGADGVGVKFRFFGTLQFSASQSLGEGKWGRKKCRRIPKREGDWQGRVPKCSLPRKPLQNKGFGAPKFSGISPKLFAALCGIHPYLCTPVLPRGQNQCAPCVAKMSSVFAQVAGELGAADPRNARWDHEAHASPGHTSETPG